MKNTLCKSLFSALVAGIFIWLAVGSEFVTGSVTEKVDLGDGKMQITTQYIHSKDETTECGQNEYGSYAGEFKTTYTLLCTETGIYIDGKRHGKIKYEYPSGYVGYKCYDMGKRVECEKSALISSANESAFNILENEYPWFLFFLNAFDFDAEHIQSFFDRIETNLTGYEFDFEEFDDYYDSALEEIEESGEEFSEIMEVNSIKVMVEGYECLKRVELRKAVIDRHRAEGETTFDIVKSDYPGYLEDVLSFSGLDATENDFKLFCNDLDNRMDSLRPLDTEDPFFTDSLDLRMYNAYYSILLENESLNALVLETKSAFNIKNVFSINQLQSYASFLLKQLIAEENPENAAIIVGELLEQEYYKGDIIRQCVKQAYSVPGSGGSDFAGQWEYWFNTGYDGRVTNNFGQAGSNNIPTDGLDAGMHTLHFRFRDEKGLWSVPQSFLFFKGGQLLSSYEYWFNDDYSDKVSLETNGSDSLQFKAALQTTHLANGMHWVHFRFKDDSGIYSPLQSPLFWKTGQKLVAYEFWYDDNFNNRSAGHISGGKEENWIKIVELDAVNFEKISARYKDSGGLWSSVVSLDVPESVSAMILEGHPGISVFPNPASEALNISYRAETGESVVFMIYDIQGTKIFTENFGRASGIEQIKTVDVSHLTNGVYLLIIETGDERSVFKAVISR
jgi:hypothetical protein